MNELKGILRLLTAEQRSTAAFIVVLMVGAAFLETFGVCLIAPIVTFATDANIAARSPRLAHWVEKLGNPSQVQLVVGGMLLLVITYFVKALYLTFALWRQSRFAFGVQAELSRRLFGIYLRQPYGFHLRRNSAELLNNAIGEVSQFRYDGLMSGMVILSEGMVLVGITSLLIAIEPLAVSVVAAVAAAAYAFYRMTRARVAEWGEARQRDEAKRVQHLQQGLGGVKEVKLLGREEYFLRRFDGYTIATTDVGARQATLQQVPRLLLELFAVIALAALMFIMMARGANLAAVMPKVALFTAAAFRIMPSVTRVLTAVHCVRFCKPVIESLGRETALPVPPAGIRPVAALPFREALHLREVGYIYDEASAPALCDVSLTIPLGQTVGFIGPSGAGKSTLIDVILGLLPPTTGTILVDAQNVQTSLAAWQRQVGYVPQSIFLTDDTLRRNIAFGVPDAEIQPVAVARAVAAAQLGDFVASLPEGLDTMVGERGVRLSGGQRQRIGIARALYHDPSVLVLDEATSALDNSTEREVMRAVHALHGQKTILIVAHRLSTVEACDRIFKLAHGRLVEADRLMTQRSG